MTREEYINILEIEKAELTKENQELKKYLKVPENCNLKTLEDYKSYYEDTTREQILEDTYIEYCAYVNLAHRYSELKKQLKPNYYIKGLEGTLKEYQEAMTKYDTQQKEFIKYLEDEIYNIEPKGTGINYNCECDSEEDYVRAMQEQSRLNTLKESLQKYKEIIGDDK